jgi:hypothetical protein
LRYINGKSVTAQIDTMYTGSLLVYNASIKKLGLGEAAKTTATRHFAYTDGGVTMKIAPIVTLDLHNGNVFLQKDKRAR